MLALLPSYQEQGDSSLIAMVDHFIKISDSPNSSYAMVKDINSKLENAVSSGQNVLLIGVSYALLDAVITTNFCRGQFIVMETGGMKGRKREMIRSELHQELNRKYNQLDIHSEYGMTELMSQAYAKKDGLFKTPPWMKVMIRDMNDPFDFHRPGQNGGINIIDLGNINTCAFIETRDIGVLKDNGAFEVLGRLDNSDLRGCNLLMA